MKLKRGKLSIVSVSWLCTFGNTLCLSSCLWCTASQIPSVCVGALHTLTWNDPILTKQYPTVYHCSTGYIPVKKTKKSPRVGRVSKIPFILLLLLLQLTISSLICHAKTMPKHGFSSRRHGCYKTWQYICSSLLINRETEWDHTNKWLKNTCFTQTNTKIINMREGKNQHTICLC